MSDEMMTALETDIQAGKYDRCLMIAYDVLESLFAQDPSLRTRILNLYQKVMKSDKNQSFNLAGAFLEMRKFAYEEPALIDQVLDMLDTGLTSNKNDSSSLTEAYGALGYIVGIDPAQAPRAVATIQKTLASDKNDDRSLDEACFTLNYIAQIDPSQAQKAFDITQTVMKSHENDETSLCPAEDLRNLALFEVKSPKSDGKKIANQQDKTSPLRFRKVRMARQKDE